MHVIILAQGTQRRMGAGAPLKQMLPLTGYGDIPIMMRTLYQVAHRFARTSLRLDVIAWEALKLEVGRLDASLLEGATFVELEDPGNSSLRGIGSFLRDQPLYRGHDHTIVLLGDVVYSWACLDVLAARRDPPRGVFAGTSNLTSGGGELWGVAWSTFFENQMRADLEDALLRHPSFDDTYQPGQLRRWIAGWRKGTIEHNVERRRSLGQYADVDDYTMDVDTPHDIKKLSTVGEVAKLDDTSRGLHLEMPYV